MVRALTFQGVIKPLYNGLLNLVHSVADPLFWIYKWASACPEVWEDGWVHGLCTLVRGHLPLGVWWKQLMKVMIVIKVPNVQWHGIGDGLCSSFFTSFSTLGDGPQHIIAYSPCCVLISSGAFRKTFFHTKKVTSISVWNSPYFHCVKLDLLCRYLKWLVHVGCTRQMWPTSAKK